MFRADARERWGKPLLVSVGVHLGAAVWMLSGAGQLAHLPSTVWQSEVSVDLASPRTPALTAVAVAVAGPTRGRRARRPRLEPISRPQPSTPIAEPEAADEEDDDVGPPASSAVSRWAGGSSAEGDGASDSGGGASNGRRGRPRELVARVVGSGAGLGELGQDAPVVSLKEATALRLRDYFPRLPAASWPEARPYIVRVGLCVSEAGVVSRAVLQSAASPTLDPVVLAAVRTWRYRPRTIDGEPRPFCHAVTIAYERSY
jgi:hypothetical protein